MTSISSSPYSNITSFTLDILILKLTSIYWNLLIKNTEPHMIAQLGDTKKKVEKKKRNSVTFHLVSEWVSACVRWEMLTPTLKRRENFLVFKMRVE